MKILFALAVFCLFFTSPSLGTLGDRSLQFSSTDKSSVLSFALSESAPGEKHEKESDDDNAASQTVLDDEENLVEFPTFRQIATEKQFFDRHDSQLPDGIARRLFKPPKA